MASNLPVKSGWQVKHARGGRDVAYHVLPTMADTGEVDLRNFFRMVYRHKWILILTMAATMSATLYWTLHATPLYTADVLIVVETRPSSIVKVDEAVQDVSSDSMKVNTEVAVLKSRGLAARVIRDLRLDTDPEFAPAALAGVDSATSGSGEEAPSIGFLAKANPRALLSAFSLALESVRSFLTSAWAGADGSDPREAAGEGQPSADQLETIEARKSAALLDQFLKRLSVESEDKSRLIRISFASSDPAKSTLIANKIVDEYMASQLESKSEGARHAAEWLKVRLVELGDTVMSLAQNVQKQRAETGSNRIDIVAQRLAQLNTQLVGAQAAAAAARARYEQVRSVLQSHRSLDALPAVIASPTVQGLRAKHTELIGRVSELQAIYGEKHPQIISVRAEIAQIEQQLQREIDNILAGLRNELESAEMHEAALRSDLEAVNEEMVGFKESEAAIGQVAQRLQANQDLYQNLLKRYTEAVALRENQQPDARIISPAQIPLKPSYPDFPRMIALSFVGSASLAIFWLVVTERLRQKLDTVEDVERHIGMQVIGTIPDLPRLRRAGSGPRDYIQREPLSEFGGAFQRLRALLTLSNNRVMPRTVLVTSGTAAEGKTTIAVCLAIASISSGQKVLLVDCDFARPQVHRMLGVRNSTGLTDILKGTANLQEAITQADGSRLSILTVGRSPDGAIDLLNSARMEGLLTELKRLFDIIILDSAPVQVSNALILGGLAEKTIFVTRREWTTHSKASYAMKQLQLYGAEIAGVVFNRASTVTSYAT
jgi:succinoglycan biosynthesis transport protein ExoP